MTDQRLYLGWLWIVRDPEHAFRRQAYEALKQQGLNETQISKMSDIERAKKLADAGLEPEQPSIWSAERSRRQVKRYILFTSDIYADKVSGGFKDALGTYATRDEALVALREEIDKHDASSGWHARWAHLVDLTCAFGEGVEDLEAEVKRINKELGFD